MKKIVILTAVISTLLMMTSCSESGGDVSSTSTTPAVTTEASATETTTTTAETTTTTTTTETTTTTAAKPAENVLTFDDLSLTIEGDYQQQKSKSTEHYTSWVVVTNGYGFSIIKTEKPGYISAEDFLNDYMALDGEVYSFVSGLSDCEVYLSTSFNTAAVADINGYFYVLTLGSDYEDNTKDFLAIADTVRPK